MFFHRVPFSLVIVLLCVQVYTQDIKPTEGRPEPEPESKSESDGMFCYVCDSSNMKCNDPFDAANSSALLTSCTSEKPVCAKLVTSYTYTSTVSTDGKKATGRKAIGDTRVSRYCARLTDDIDLGCSDHLGAGTEGEICYCDETECNSALGLVSTYLFLSLCCILILLKFV